MEKINDRLVQLEIDVLSANDKKAAQNREKFIADGVLALNLVSSPGSGKTTLLCNTINKIKDQYSPSPATASSSAPWVPKPTAPVP